MTALQQHGVALYRTDKQGEITVYSDGENCWFSTNPCEDWTPGSQTAPDTPLATTLPQSARFELNTHTKKFHDPDCPSVEQMSDKNKDFCLANLPSMDFRQHPEELLSLMPWSAYMQSCFKQDE